MTAGTAMSNGPPPPPPDPSEKITVNVSAIDWTLFWGEGITQIAGALLNPEFANVLGAALLLGQLARLKATLAVRAQMGTKILEQIDQFEAESQGLFAKAVAAGLSDYFNTTVSPAEVGGTGESGRRRELAERMGTTFINEFIRQVDAAAPLTPEGAQDRAGKFLGFNLSTAIESFFETNRILTTLGDFIPAWQDLDEVVRDATGLNRAARKPAALLSEILVSTPFEWQLNKTYRPRLPGISDVLRGFLRGRLTREEMDELLGRLGLDVRFAEPLLNNARRFLLDTDLYLFLQFGLWTEAEAIQHLRDSGFDERVARAALAAEEVRRVRAQVTAFINVLERATLDGFISLPTFAGILDTLPLTDQEKRWEREIVGTQLELPRKSLTLAQMRAAFFDGIVNLFEWEEFLEVEGYAADDKEILTIQLLLDAQRKEEAEERKAARAARVAQRQAAAAARAGAAPA